MKLSVVMATYNGEKYIKEQLDSIVPFLLIDDELIISDDNSSDRTREIIQEYIDNYPNIQLIEGPCMGVVKNFENALLQACGDICMFADQDDIWLPEKLSYIREYFEKNDVNLVMHDMYLASNEDIMTGTILSRSFLIRKRKHGFLYNIILNGYYGCCMCFKLDFVKTILPFPDCTTMYDQLIGLYAEKKGSVAFIDRPLIIHRKHGENMSQKSSFFNQIRSRINLIKSFTDAYKNIKI